MLKYSIDVLERVSFDTELFWKEYRKAEAQVEGEEKKELQKWLRRHLIQEKLGKRPAYSTRSAA